MTMIQNTCSECGKRIHIAEPVDDDGDTDYSLVRVLKNNSDATCRTCEPLSDWRRII